MLHASFLIFPIKTPILAPKKNLRLILYLKPKIGVFIGNIKKLACNMFLLATYFLNNYLKITKEYRNIDF